MLAHQDKTPWSFVIALNDDFEGGGTYFVKREKVWKNLMGKSQPLQRRRC